MVRETDRQLATAVWLYTQVARIKYYFLSTANRSPPEEKDFVGETVKSVICKRWTVVQSYLFT